MTCASFLFRNETFQVMVVRMYPATVIFPFGFISGHLVFENLSRSSLCDQLAFSVSVVGH